MAYQNARGYPVGRRIGEAGHQEDASIKLEGEEDDVQVLGSSMSMIPAVPNIVSRLNQILVVVDIDHITELQTIDSPVVFPLTRLIPKTHPRLVPDRRALDKVNYAKFELSDLIQEVKKEIDLDFAFNTRTYRVICHGGRSSGDVTRLGSYQTMIQLVEEYKDVNAPKLRLRIERKAVAPTGLVNIRNRQGEDETASTDTVMRNNAALGASVRGEITTNIEMPSTAAINLRRGTGHRYTSKSARPLRQSSTTADESSSPLRDHDGTLDDGITRRIVDIAKDGLASDFSNVPSAVNRMPVTGVQIAAQGALPVLSSSKSLDTKDGGNSQIRKANGRFGPKKGSLAKAKDNLFPDLKPYGQFEPVVSRFGRQAVKPTVAASKSTLNTKFDSAALGRLSLSPVKNTGVDEQSGLSPVSAVDDGNATRPTKIATLPLNDGGKAAIESEVAKVEEASMRQDPSYVPDNGAPRGSKRQRGTRNPQHSTAHPNPPDLSDANDSAAAERKSSYGRALKAPRLYYDETTKRR